MERIERDLSDVIDALEDLGYRFGCDDERGLYIDEPKYPKFVQPEGRRYGGHNNKAVHVWDDAENILHLIDKGRTAKQISTIYGCSPTLIIAVARKFGKSMLYGKGKKKTSRGCLGY